MGNAVGTRFLGIIEPHPVTGRWIWPFRQMEVGDWFLVRQSERDPEALRNMAAVRGSQLMMRFGFTKCDTEHPGMSKVWRKPNWEPPVKRTNFDYQGLKALLREQYEIDADAITWHIATKAGDSFNEPVHRIQQDERWAVRVMVGDHPYIVELLDRGLHIHRIDNSETLDSWMERQIEAILR